VLTRTNAQLEPIEEAFTQAQIGYQVRGGRFFDRREVRDAITLARHARLELAGVSLAEALRELWGSELGYGVESGGREARERDAALDTLLAILARLRKQDPSAGAEAFLAELDRRATAERQGAVGGVELLTYHRAKGLEWDAVFLPALEEGSLPIRQAFDSDEALAEERRLLYVGITRARRYLALSWADRRTNPQGREVTQRPSRFLRDLGAPTGAARARPSADGRRSGARAPGSRSGSPLSEALRAWRSERARADAMPAYVIAHDSTIEAIAEARPGSIAALRRVRGMGPQKLEKYGPEILAVVAAAR
jgi:DNA helicase-2/ATP-dependent DNA helicase PcrA